MVRPVHTFSLAVACFPVRIFSFFVFHLLGSKRDYGEEARRGGREGERKLTMSLVGVREI